VSMFSRFRSCTARSYAQTRATFSQESGSHSAVSRNTKWVFALPFSTGTGGRRERFCHNPHADTARARLGRTRPAGLLAAFHRPLRGSGSGRRLALPAPPPPLNEARRPATVVGYAARYELKQERERHRCAAGRADSSGVENTMMKRVVERLGLR
jgi:hypothetical protein